MSNINSIITSYNPAEPNDPPLTCNSLRSHYDPNTYYSPEIVAAREKALLNLLHSSRVKEWKNPSPYDPANPRTQRRYDYPDPEAQKAADAVENVVADIVKKNQYQSSQPLVLTHGTSPLPSEASRVDSLLRLWPNLVRILPPPGLSIMRRILTSTRSTMPSSFSSSTRSPNRHLCSQPPLWLQINSPPSCRCSAESNQQPAQQQPAAPYSQLQSGCTRHLKQLRSKAIMARSYSRTISTKVCLDPVRISVPMQE